MAKDSYKIPVSLSENYFDMEIALQDKDGVGLKPLPVRVILMWLFGILLFMWLCSNEQSVIAYMGLTTKIIFGIGYFAFLWIATQVDKSHRMQIELIPAALSYIQPSNRNVLTRKVSNAAPFYGIVGIESIDEESGMVKYVDDTYAYWYSVVGNASVLLFPSDQEAILDRVDDFYKKIQPDCEIIFMTTKEPQRVYKQISHLMAQYDALEFRDPDIDLLVKEQYDTLKDFVGNEFKSLHQYMILKGDNKEALTTVNNIVISEINGSNLMFKQMTPMYRSEIEEALHLVYGNINDVK